MSFTNLMNEYTKLNYTNNSEITKLVVCLTFVFLCIEAQQYIMSVIIQWECIFRSLYNYVEISTVHLFHNIIRGYICSFTSWDLINS